MKLVHENFVVLFTTFTQTQGKKSANGLRQVLWSIELYDKSELLNADLVNAITK